ncbi:MAG TPA: type II toxin-antitoxin system VapB family antitoxin [Dehalococcoidia bacterium]|jgi:Arc/MetJ family transcription regulator
MRTTVDIDPKLLEEVERIAGEKTLSKAVTRALEDYVRRRKIEELIALAGKVDIEENWRELEELELAKMKKLEW